MCVGQNLSGMIDEQLKKDSLNSLICKKEGHVCKDLYRSTAMYCPPYIVETDSGTVVVTPGCNILMYVCDRCNKMVYEQEKERRELITK